MVLVQQLTEHDFEIRQTSCEQLVGTLPNDALLFFSDEAYFHLTGCVNKQNMRYWSEMNPKELHQRPLHSDSVTVWCAVSRMGIIGPYFFEENGRAVTVNSVRYLTVIEEFFTCSPRNRNDQRVVPARWSHSPHCQNVNRLF